MELANWGVVPEWNDQHVPFQTEHIVKFTEDGCRPLDGVQTSFHLI